MKKAKKNKLTVSQKMELEKEIITRKNRFKRKPIVIGHLLSNLATSQPDNGRPNILLMGMTNNMEPSCASLMSRAVFMVGIRDAQLAKLNPAKKNKILNAIRCLVFSSFNV